MILFICVKVGVVCSVWLAWFVVRVLGREDKRRNRHTALKGDMRCLFELSDPAPIEVTGVGLCP